MTAVEWLIDKHFGGIENCTPDFRKHIEEAIEMEKQQQDNFAIGFAEYCLKFDNLKNESTYLIEQLLKIYKKEKEL